MADFDLNLSTQPFPAYRLINVALACVLVFLVLVSVWQASGFLQYSRMSQSILPAERTNRVEAEALGKHVAELESRLERPESSAKLNEIGFLNHLIVRKSLSWTRLFAILEKMVPENVHLTNLTPEIGEDGAVTLRLGVRARGMPDVKEFLQRFEKSPLFGGLDVRVEEKTDPAAPADVQVTLSAIYYPQRGKE
jgi:cell division protein FtsB